LIALNVRPKPASLSRIITDIDPQHIAIMAISGFFGLFTGTLVVTHFRLICLNLSTLEHVKLVHMQETEAALLGQMFSCWEFGEKGRTKREWDEQWGDLNTEGNIWWLGSSRKNWESVMGENIWGWFLPIGRPESDGLEYPINPRFDRDGRWRRRSEWPEEFR
jgi:palmitoyltransferase